LARVLGRRFYAQPPLELAAALLNKVLVRDDADGRMAARLVEVEAYHGSEDPGSHAYRGATPRTTVMFGPPGHLYVYFTYGMHWCMNVVAQHPPGDAGAVLLRAAEPLEGLDVMRARRPRARRDRDLCSGPAKLAQAFAIDGAYDGVDLTSGALRIVDDGVPPPAVPLTTVRVGLATGKGEELPWRLCVPGHRHLSR
jgi:DNA-3-methyladenine glycosylase